MGEARHPWYGRPGSWPRRVRTLSPALPGRPTVVVVELLITLPGHQRDTTVVKLVG